MKKLKTQILATLMLTLPTTLFSQNNRKTIVTTQPFDVDQITGWVLAGSALLPTRFLNWVLEDTYLKSMCDIDLSYLKNTKEIRLAINEEKYGRIQELTVTCTDDQSFTFEFEEEFSFSGRDIEKRKSKSLRPYFAAYGAGCSIPLSKLEDCEIKSIDVKGYTERENEQRVRVDFLVPTKDSLVIAEL